MLHAAAHHHVDASPAHGATTARRRRQQCAGARLEHKAHSAGNKVRACHTRVGRPVADIWYAISPILARLCHGQGATTIGATVATAAAAPGIGAADPDGRGGRLLHGHGARGSLLRRRLVISGRGDGVRGDDRSRGDQAPRADAQLVYMYVS